MSLYTFSNFFVITLTDNRGVHDCLSGDVLWILREKCEDRFPLYLLN